MTKFKKKSTLIHSVDTPAWHTLDTQSVITKLQTDLHSGLTEKEASRRLKEHGPNTLLTIDRKHWYTLFGRQFTDVLIIILLVAAVIAWATGDLTDTVMILIIVILNASLGFSQEYRAEKAMAAMKRLEQPHVLVRRDGELLQISSQDLIPGDIMSIEAGGRVPADGRLIEATHLKLDESHLTGESIAVTKSIRTLHRKDLPLGDRANLIFMGTTVNTGHAWAVVSETGMRTELGRVAHLLQTVEERKTPLQARLAYLGKWLAVAALGMTAVIFIAGLLRGEPLDLMLLTAISLAVAVIPEGLPAVVTITLALGAQRMVQRNALIRKLPAVETLGCVTTICSDKTGTLTQNLMSVELVYLNRQLVDVTGNGYRPEGNFYKKGKELNPRTDPVLLKLLKTGVLCTNAHLKQEKGQWTILGDPTEGALLVVAAKAGLWKEKLAEEYPRIDEIPFDSARKLMTTVHRDPKGQIWAFTKGSIEEILRRSTAVMEEEEIKPLTRHRHDEIVRINRELASDGVRVLGCAMRRLETMPPPKNLGDVEEDMVFLGLFGMLDPPRPEVKMAVTRCREAGIRPVMITGDHRITADAIATNLEVKYPEDRILTGEDLEAMTTEQLEPQVQEVSVYARVSPEHKMKIIQALKHRGEIVAMTGDGVNDAPALRSADIGVAMGRGGTDVAREASEMVLLDDNFATIVSAVGEGRIIYDNIRKFTRYMLSTNSGEILTMFLAIIFGLPLPLLPIQILWMNLVTDGLPALALGVEPAESEIMRRPPRHPKESIFAGGLGFHIIWVGLLMGLATISVFAWTLRYHDLIHGRTMVFFTLTMFQMFHVMAIRSERDSLWRIGLLTNVKLLGAVFLTVVLQLVITYSSLLQPVFRTTALTAGELMACIAVASTVYFAAEGEKVLRYRRITLK